MTRFSLNSIPTKMIASVFSAIPSYMQSVSVNQSVYCVLLFIRNFNEAIKGTSYGQISCYRK